MGSVQRIAGTPVSMQISRHFVLHYLEPTTRAIVAELDGRFMGVTLSRVAGEPLAFPQAKQELAAINGELNRSTLGAKTLSETEQWHEMELRMEREIDINDVARGEIELFLVAKSARGHGVGGSLWRQAMDYFANCQVARFYLHTDSSCDVSFYDHKGLNCIAARYAAPSRGWRRHGRHLHLRRNPGEHSMSGAQQQSRSVASQSPYAQLFRIPGAKAFCISGAVADCRSR